MSHPTALDRLTRRLNLIGTALLAAAFVAFVWAVGFTTGVEGLVEGLVIAAVGLFVPGAAALWVSWIIGSSAADDAIVEPASESTRRERFVLRLRNYTVAALAVLIATVLRAALTPFLGQLAPFPTFFLAVTVAAWLGGTGPGVFAALLSVAVGWMLYLHPADPVAGTTGELVSAGLFIAVSLAIAGITSALRLTQLRAASLRDSLAEHDTMLEESEASFQALADRASALIRVSDASQHATYLNAPWLAFAGRTLEQGIGDGWLECVHADDRNRLRARIGRAVDAREPYTVEYRLRRRDGTYVRHRESGMPRIRRDGRLAGYVAEIVDLADVSRIATPRPALPEPPPAERGTVK
jgi:PAS domain S-box-containing protein